MTVTAELLDQFERELDERPDDWDLRRIAADAYLDAGDELRSAFLRWSAENRKCPKFHSHGYAWYWWGCNHVLYPTTSHLPDGLHPNDLHDFAVDMGSTLGGYDSNSRLGAEKDLATYLRHHGVI